MAALQAWLRPAAPYLVAGLALLGGLALFGDTLSEKLGGQLASGPAPEFSLQLFDGDTLSSQDLRGKVVVLNFWASWCTECRKEAPTLQKVWERYRDRGVVLVGVNYVDLEDLARAYIAEFGFTFPNGPDVEQRIARAFRMQGVPETFFIDRNWNLRGVHIGRSTEADLVRQIEELLADGGSGES